MRKSYNNNNQNDSDNSMSIGRDVKQMQNLFREIQDGVSQNKNNIDKARGANQNIYQNIEEQQQQPQTIYQDQNLGVVNDQFQNKVSQLQNHLAKSNATNELLYKKLMDQEEQLAQANSQLKRVHGEKSYKANQVEDLNFKFHDVAQTHQEFLKNARNHSQTIQQELEQKEREVFQLKKQLNDAHAKLSVVSVTQEKNMDSCIQFDSRVRKLEEENLELLAQLSKQKQNNDILTLEKKAEGTFMVEVEHLRSDVKRLVSMLKSTTEYKEFGELAEDSGQIRFLKGVKSKSYVDYGASCKCKITRPCIEDEVVDERCLWVPEEAWKFAHNFRLQYDGELTETLIERLLFEFSKIWARRESRLVSRVKASCASESSSLRRQIAYNPKYDEHQAKATITRLKKQLKDAYRENREVHADRYARNPPGIKWVAETMKITGKANKEVKRAKEQNQVLRNKLKDVESLQFQDNSEKTHFMEGAAWVARTLQQDSDKLSQQWQNIGEKLQGGDQNIQAMDQIMKQFSSKVQGYRASCQKEMLLASQNVASVKKPSSTFAVINDGF